MIKGYKIFIGNKNCFVNNYKKMFEVGKIYEVRERIHPKDSGYHFALRLEDTLRYGNAKEEEFVLCEVTALGNIVEYEDEYYGYYDLYVTDKIRIDKILTRNEIIDYALKLPDYRLIRLIATMKLDDEEVKLFLNRETEVLKYIDYYHYGNKDAFKIKRIGAFDGRKNF